LRRGLDFAFFLVAARGGTVVPTWNRFITPSSRFVMQAIIE
jgi:hypothetical protein